MKNVRIREVLHRKNMKQWELAECLGISEYTLCKRLRRELPEEEQVKMIAIIENYGKEV